MTFGTKATVKLKFFFSRKAIGHTILSWSLAINCAILEIILVSVSCKLDLLGKFLAVTYGTRLEGAFLLSITPYVNSSPGRDLIAYV